MDHRLFATLAVVLCILTTVIYAAKLTPASSKEKPDSSSEESGESKERPVSFPHRKGFTPPLPRLPFQCTHLNRTYNLGEQIETPDTPCLHCTCTKRWTQPSGSSCAIIDCPFQYYRSRPHCTTKYVEGKCCPELLCAPPTPGREIELLARKKPRTSTDKMVIVASPGKEVTLYCVAENDGEAPLNGDLARWIRRGPDGDLYPLEFGDRFTPQFFPPKTWALLLDNLQDEDDGDYICQVATVPPQSYTTTLKIQIRPPSRIEACTAPTTVDLAPGQYTCDHLPSPGWYYNSTLYMCEEYANQPCKKPVNYFSSKSECYHMCGDACYDPKNEGSCEVREKRYYYDHVKDECSSFTYNGCKGNRNNFATKEECENTCADVKFRLLDVAGRATPLIEPVEELPPCHNMECPWHEWTYYMWKGCKAVTKPNACCPHRFECPSVNSSEEVTEHPNRFDLGTYHCAGKFADKFSYSKPNCLSCACDPVNKTFVCEGGSQGGSKCLAEVDVAKHIRDGCLGVYTESECCPHSYRCPISYTNQQRGPQEEFPEEPELRCVFANKSYPRGYELIVSDACTTCTCQTPPDFTCVVQTCPPHPSVTNTTLRCEARGVHGPQCCPEYDCWDIIEKPLVIGKPQTPKEIEACDKNTCPEHHTCIVNYTQCYLGDCDRSCRMCPTPLCSSGSVLEQQIHDCPVCAGYKTPEEACNMNDYCPPDTLCNVDEERCRYEGKCEPQCEIQETTQIFVPKPQNKVCPMPRCPPACGRKEGSDGCPQCDCTVPRGPIKETPCIKECPQDCGQKTLLDGCLECICDSNPFNKGTPPTPTKPECVKECPQDCGRTKRGEEDGHDCYECHCDSGPFFGNHGTPKPPAGANQQVAPEKPPCASVSCTFPCWAAPADEDGCSKNCLCPRTEAEACAKMPCPSESKCSADCDDYSCKPKCMLQLKCPTAICTDAACTLEKDEHGCMTVCKCP